MTFMLVLKDKNGVTLEMGDTLRTPDGQVGVLGNMEVNHKTYYKVMGEGFGHMILPGHELAKYEKVVQQ